MLQEATAAGYFNGSNIIDSIPHEQQLKTESDVTHAVDITPFFDTKQSAMRAHLTQFSEEHMFRKVPREMMIKASGKEYFIQVDPSPAEALAQDPLPDLFTDL